MQSKCASSPLDVASGRGLQPLEHLDMGCRPAALALSPNALALAALGPGPGGAGCALCVALLPDSACVRRPDGAAGGDAPSCEDVLGARHAPSLCLCHRTEAQTARVDFQGPHEGLPLGERGPACPVLRGLAAARLFARVAARGHLNMCASVAGTEQPR